MSTSTTNIVAACPNSTGFMGSSSPQLSSDVAELRERYDQTIEIPRTLSGECPEKIRHHESSNGLADRNR